MSREHAPRPGVTWDRQLVRQEVYVGLGQVPTTATLAFSDRLANSDGEPTTTVDGLNEPVPPRLNREQRRAAKRAQRRKGGRR